MERQDFGKTERSPSRGTTMAPVALVTAPETVMRVKLPPGRASGRVASALPGSVWRRVKSRDLRISSASSRRTVRVPETARSAESLTSKGSSATAQSSGVMATSKPYCGNQKSQAASCRSPLALRTATSAETNWPQSRMGRRASKAKVPSAPTVVVPSMGSSAARTFQVTEAPESGVPVRSTAVPAKRTGSVTGSPTLARRSSTVKAGALNAITCPI